LPANSVNGQYSEWKYLLIEEPFDLTNTARSVFDQRVFSQIINVFKKSAEIYGSLRNVDFLFEKKFNNFNNLNGRYDSYN
jgi:poly(A) RNA polymerase GLD2